MIAEVRLVTPGLVPVGVEVITAIERIELLRMDQLHQRTITKLLSPSSTTLIITIVVVIAIVEEVIITTITTMVVVTIIIEAVVVIIQQTQTTPLEAVRRT